MFENLRTSTKLILLCIIFLISVGVLIYNLVTEKKIAISFARQELAGSQFLATLRGIDVAVLKAKPLDPLGADFDSSVQRALEVLELAQTNAAYPFQTLAFVQAISSSLRLLGSTSSTNASESVNALAKVQQLALRVGDDSNLTLDTELDTYYMQNILVDKLPRFLDKIGELQFAMRKDPRMAISSNEGKAKVLLLDGLVDSTTSEIKSDLTAAYRGNADGSLKRAVDSTFATLLSATDSYLGKLRAALPDGGSVDNL